MLIRKSLLITLYFTFITCSMQAQDNSQDGFQVNTHEEEQHLTYDQMTEFMVSELHLDEKQQVKLAKINRRFKNLIEGDLHQPPMMGGRSKGQEGAPSGGGPMGGRGGGSMGGGMMGGGPMGGRGGSMGGGMMGGGPMGGHGGGMGGGPMGGHRGPEEYDYDRQQTKYDKAVRKLFSEEQFEGYKKIKQQFYSQRRVRDFLLGNQSTLNTLSN